MGEEFWGWLFDYYNVVYQQMIKEGLDSDEDASRIWLGIHYPEILDQYEIDPDFEALDENLSLKDVVKIIDQEILWCLRHPGASTMVPADIWEHGFISGLRQAKGILASFYLEVNDGKYEGRDPRREVV